MFHKSWKLDLNKLAKQFGKVKIFSSLKR